MRRGNRGIFSQEFFGVSESRKKGLMSVVRTDVLRQTRESGIRLIRFLYCDTSAIIRGKSTLYGDLNIDS